MAHQCEHGRNVVTDLDVRALPPPERHPRIHQLFEGLEPGEAFVLVEDHDPQALFRQFQAECPGGFGWQYLEQGPGTWRVRITKRAAVVVGDAAPARAPLPAVLAAVPASDRVPVDVRPVIARGEEPFRRIIGAVEGLTAGQVLVLRAPFEPVPLYGVLARRGFAHWTECFAPDDWSVWFYRPAQIPAGHPC